MNKKVELRKHKRLPVRTNVFVSGVTFERFKTQTMDFSDGGLFIEGKALAGLEVNSIIEVQSADIDNSPPILTARVAWTNRYGAGIQYLLSD